jgi:hypothetical protein
LVVNFRSLSKPSLFSSECYSYMRTSILLPLLDVLSQIALLIDIRYYFQITIILHFTNNLHYLFLFKWYYPINPCLCYFLFGWPTHFHLLPSILVSALKVSLYSKQLFQSLFVFYLFIILECFPLSFSNSLPFLMCLCSNGIDPMINQIDS